MYWLINKICINHVLQVQPLQQEKKKKGSEKQSWIQTPLRFAEHFWAFLFQDMLN